METLKPKSSLHSKSKLARTFQKVCSLRTTSTKVSSNNGMGICMLTSQNPNFDDDDDDGDSVFDQKSTVSSRNGDVRERQRAVLEAVIAKIFASATAIKAAYAELQMAQRPYDSVAVQTADQAVVDELRALSELKRSFLKKDMNLSPQVTIMLAEIQEQQSLMRTYEITIKKLESAVKEKESQIDSLRMKIDETAAFNKSLEKKLSASGSLSLFDNIQFRTLNFSHFTQILSQALRSVRYFVKTTVNEMTSANWDLAAAAAAAVSIRDASTVFVRPSHRCFAFESFVCEKMFENFGSPNFSLPNLAEKPSREQFFNRFKNLRSADPIQYLIRNPGSSFARFTRQKYLNVVHAKMECSFFGNLNQRKLVNSGGFPDSDFFVGFSEMAKRVWLLHCVAFSLHENVSVFQLKRGSRFSQVYMENVTPDESPISGENINFRVGFTVVPGFKIGETVIQSQVYLFPAAGPPPPASSMFLNP